MPTTDSEFRLYKLIQEKLQEIGWDIKSPKRGGQVYTQGEALKNADLKDALGQGRPEFIVDLGDKEYWAIEAKARIGDLSKAVKEAKGRARQINASDNKISCRIITGVAGSPDTTYYVETYCLVGREWKPLLINKRQSTGFISPDQVKAILDSGRGRLDDYKINDKLFLEKIEEISEVLHRGAINKKKRAETLACLLLALANDQGIQLNKDPATLIGDINSRARRELQKHNKGNCFKEIEIHSPTSADNHVKNRNALAKSIEILRDLNIASTIDSGRDVLGQCYEQFLKYANDAKELGIVFTPRHITNMGAKIIDIQKRDIVFDPTCGTGGFLVAALDKVKADNGNIEGFKKGNLYGVEQDPLIATLAIANMVFRGDGSSNIWEGDCFKKDLPLKCHKVLMNPPFSLDRGSLNNDQEYEWKFVDKALESMHKKGLLFAVLPTTVMDSANDARGEITWRENLLKRHSLIAVIKLAEDLFYPQVSKGTYGVVIKAHCPHDLYKGKVVWAVLHDGVVRTKMGGVVRNNVEEVIQAVKGYISAKIEPKYIPSAIDCSSIEKSGYIDLSPEHHIGRKRGKKEPRSVFDTRAVYNSMEDGKRLLESISPPSDGQKLRCKAVEVCEFFQEIARGKSGRQKNQREGNVPLISTSERNNGISARVHKDDCDTIYKAGCITISANGSSCRAHYHDYDFAANPDVYVGLLKPEYNEKYFALFLCAAINNEDWRYNYYRKLSTPKLKRLLIKMPVCKGGGIDFDEIKKLVETAMH